MRLIKIAFILILVLTLLLVLMPFAAKHYALAWLEERDFSASIGDIDLNPLLGTWSIQNLQIESRDGEKLSVYEASLPFKPLDLFSKKFSLEVAQLNTVSVDVRPTVRGYDIAGLPMDAFLPVEEDGWAWSARRFGITDMTVCMRERQHCMQIENVVLSGARLLRDEISEDANSAVLHVDQGLSLSKLFYRDQASGAAILFVNEFKTQSTRWSAADTHLRNLAINNLQWVETPAEEGTLAEVPYQTQMANLEIDTVAADFEKNTLRLGSVEINSLRQAFHYDSDGNNVLRSSLLKWFPDKESTVQNGITLSALSIDALKLTGSEWLIDDKSIAPPVKAAWDNIHLTLGAIDSNKADVSSPFTVSAKMDESGSFSAEGNWWVFAPNTQFDAIGRVGNFDISGISAYASRLFDQKVTQGILDATFDGKVVDGVMDVDSIWRLTDFTFVPGTAKRTSTMPLNRSVALLEDTNNSVRVEVSISGDLRDDSTKLGTLVGSPMRKALSRQVRQGGSNKTRPVAALTATKPGQLIVSSLVYDANATQPRDHEVRRLETLAKRLKEKSNLRMTFCPVATGGEWADIYNAGNAPKGGVAPITNAQRSALVKLAEKRSVWITSHLKKIGVSQSQIIPCGPTLDPTESGPSYISVSL